MTESKWTQLHPLSNLETKKYQRLLNRLDPQCDAIQVKWPACIGLFAMHYINLSYVHINRQCSQMVAQGCYFLLLIHCSHLHYTAPISTLLLQWHFQVSKGICSGIFSFLYFPISLLFSENIRWQIIALVKCISKLLILIYIIFVSCKISKPRNPDSHIQSCISSRPLTFKSLTSWRVAIAFFTASTFGGSYACHINFRFSVVFMSFYSIDMQLFRNSNWSWSKNWI